MRWAILLVMTAALAAAQDGEPLIRITVGLVQVDAVVTDSKGQHITDLRKDEFILLQDGQRREITAFSFVDLESETAPQMQASRRPATMQGPNSRHAPPDPTTVRRTYALVVDDLGMSFSSIAQLRRQLNQFIDENVKPGDLVAIVRTSAGVGALQDFTTDPGRLRAAAQAVRWSPFGRRGVTPFAAIDQRPEGEQPTLLEESPAGMDAETSSLSGGTGMVQDEITTLRQRIFSVGTLGALQHTILGMGQLPGRKALIFFSESMELMSVDEFGFTNSQTDTYRRVVDAANRAGVAIYTVDPRGLVFGGYTAEDRVSSPLQLAQGFRDRQNQLFQSQSGMDLLSRQTGGRFLHGYNRLDRMAAEAVADMSGYYLLGYKPDDETFDREFHRIEVKVTRAGARVRSRRGFFGVSGSNRPARPEGRDEQLASALLSPFGASDIAIQLTAAYIVNEKREPLIHAMTHISGQALTYELRDDGKYHGSVDVLTITYGVNGQAMNETGETFRFDLPPDSLDYVKEAGFLYSLYHPLEEAGAYQLRLAARDSASGRVGAASQFIEIPKLKKNRVAMSSVYLASSDYFRQASRREGISDPATSPVLRRFRPGQSIQYRHLIMNARKARNDGSGGTDLVSRVRIWRGPSLVQQTNPLPVGQTEPLGLNPRHFWGEFPLRERLPAGEYYMEVILTDEASPGKPRTVRQWTDFSIVPPRPPKP